MSLEKIGHYSLTNPASVYDEEALTALELAGRTAAKVNEACEAFNTLEKETGDHLQEQDTNIDNRLTEQDNRITKMNDETMPAKVESEVQTQIENGTFDRQINEYSGNLKERVDNLSTLQEGSTTGDAELIDGRVDNYGIIHSNIGENIRKKINPSELSFVPVRTRKEPSNKLSRFNLIHGYYVSADGNIAKSDVFNLSDKIDVTNYKKMYCDYISNSAFYTADGTFISTFSTGIITVPENASYCRISVHNDNLDKCGMYPDVDIPGVNDGGVVCLEDVIKNNDIKIWDEVTVQGFDITFPARTVFQNSEGVFLLITATEPKTFHLNDGDILYLDFPFDVNTTELNFDRIKVEYNHAIQNQETFLSQRIASYPLITNIQRIQEGIDKERYSNVEKSELPATPSIRQSLSELAPSFYKAHKGRRRDINVVMIGDSISTANYYTEPRADAKYRPPLMTEKCYPSYIEEWLRWDGQVYNRFDVDGVFTETCDSVENLEYDSVHWDWETNNNRPAITRCLSGTNCSVSFNMDVTYLRTDYIYRTDCTNAENATVIVSTGNGFVQVWDETMEAWVEANGYVFSAKESETPISTPHGNLMKSMYQKRLKMKWNTAKSDTTITIRNNGTGRLTYWGIQKCKNDVAFNFILAARGGHSIGRLEQFEEWDVDYWKPDLILWELPIMNHQGVDIVLSDYTTNRNLPTPATFAQPFIVKCDELLAKDYTPEIICFSLWTSEGSVHSINEKGEWLHGLDTNYYNVSTRRYVDELIFNLMDKIPTLDMTSLFHEYGFDYMKFVGNDNYVEATTKGSGRDGNSWTIDGGHFNTMGAFITKKLFGDFFLK